MALYQDLAGKVALVTGGSGDLGRAIAKELGGQRCKIYITFNKNEAAAIATCDLIKEQGSTAEAIQCDITNKQQIAAAVDRIVAEQGQLDVLVNNAGIYQDNLFAMMTDEEFDQVMQTNVYGTYYCSKAAVKAMMRSQSGSVINISSIAGIAASFGQANYSAAKGAVVSLGRTLAAEMAQKKIRVNTVAPGLIDSQMVKRIPRNIMKQTLANIPLKRLGKSEEIARIVAFLASEDSSYMIGQTLIADGGLVMP